MFETKFRKTNYRIRFYNDNLISVWSLKLIAKGLRCHHLPKVGWRFGLFGNTKIAILQNFQFFLNFGRTKNLLNLWETISTKIGQDWISSARLGKTIPLFFCVRIILIKRNVVFYVVFLEIGFSFQENRNFRFYLSSHQSQLNESEMGWKWTIFIWLACQTY